MFRIGKRAVTWIVPVLAGVGALLSSAHAETGRYAGDARALASIARDIEALKARFPQLAEFSARHNLDKEALVISYAYRTHKAKHPGGWTAAVPNPDEDGIWFHIDFHSADSDSQIHTQPATVVQHCLGDRRLGFLILEGAKTRSVSGAFWEVLGRHGVAECRPPEARKRRSDAPPPLPGTPGEVRYSSETLEQLLRVLRDPASN